MHASSDAALVRVSRYFRALAEAGHANLRQRPFSILFDPTTSEPYRNYAFPDEGSAPDAEDVRALVQTFISRGRLPRLEYVPALCPPLLDVLLAEGFKAERTLPLMACQPSIIQEVPCAVAVSYGLATSDRELAAAAMVQNSAYGAGDATASDTARLERLVAAGGAVAIAWAEGEPVASGLFSAPHHSTTEIAAVGVLAPARRRGIGTDMTAFLACEAYSRGIELPFLMAAQEDEARIYRRVGFEPFATMLHISRQEPAGGWEGQRPTYSTNPN